MFILQDGKLYIQADGDKIVGIDFSSDKISKVKGSETKLGNHRILTMLEVKCKFQINEDNPYKFPKVKEDEKEVKSNATTKTKSTVRKSK